MVAFPVAKLGAIVIKQISKPLANLAKSRAKQSPFFRNYICMPPAQFYHWCEVKLKMWTMNLGKPVNIPKLTEASAIELGAELVGEAVIFTVASGILIFEYARQSRKETAKENERSAQMDQILLDLKTLYTEKAHHEEQIRELVRILQEKIPDSNFNPAPLNEQSIPKHHRDAGEPEPNSGVYDTMKGWVFNAIDFVLPPVSNTEPENQTKIIVIHHKSDPSPSDASNCKCDDSTSSSSSSKNSSSIISASINNIIKATNDKR